MYMSLHMSVHMSIHMSKHMSMHMSMHISAHTTLPPRQPPSQHCPRDGALDRRVPADRARAFFFLARNSGSMRDGRDAEGPWRLKAADDDTSGRTASDRSS